MIFYTFVSMDVICVNGAIVLMVAFLVIVLQSKVDNFVCYPVCNSERKSDFQLEVLNYTCKTQRLRAGLSVFFL